MASLTNSSAGDGPVGRAAGYEAENLELSWAESAEIVVADPFHEGSGHGGGEDGLAGVGRSPCSNELVSGSVFQEVAGGAGHDRGEDVAVGVVGGEDEHAGAGCLSSRSCWIKLRRRSWWAWEGP